MKTIIKIEKEIEEIRNTLEDVDFQKSTLSQMSELNKYIEILILERMSNQTKEFEKLIEEFLHKHRHLQKDILSQFAYQGADIPKKTILELTNKSEGFREARKVIFDLIREELLTKIRGKKK